MRPPCFTLELVTTGLDDTDPLEDEELRLGVGRFLYVSNGFVVFNDRSMVRVLVGRGPVFVCRLLNCENLECGSIVLVAKTKVGSVQRGKGRGHPAVK